MWNQRYNPRESLDGLQGLIEYPGVICACQYMCTVCILLERAYSLYWLLRGSINQIYELLRIEYNILFWLQKPGSILNVPPGRYNRMHYFFKPPLTLLEYNVMSQVKTLRNTAGRNKATLFMDCNWLCWPCTLKLWNNGSCWSQGIPARCLANFWMKTSITEGCPLLYTKALHHCYNGLIYFSFLFCLYSIHLETIWNELESRARQNNKTSKAWGRVGMVVRKCLETG